MRNVRCFLTLLFFAVPGYAQGNSYLFVLKSFDGEVCAVPLRISHYWIQTVFSAHALATYDISDLNIGT